MNHRKILLKRGFQRILSLTAVISLVAGYLAFGIPLSIHGGAGSTNYVSWDPVSGALADILPTTVAGVISADAEWYGEILVEDTVLDDHDSSTSPQVLCVDIANPDPGDGTPSNPYRTITQAVEAAYSGDEIIVAQGTYTETLFLNKDIRLSGAYSSYTSPSPWTCDRTQYETIIDGNQNGSVITFQMGSEGAVLEGFTITGGNAGEAGGGITITDVSPEIRFCIIQQNVARGDVEWGGGGLLIGGGAAPVVSNTIITGNTACGGAGGIRVGDASVTLVNCLIAGNSGRPAVHANDASLVLTNVTIADHGTEGGILLNNSQAVIANTIIWEETGVDLYTVNGGDYIIECSDVEDGVPSDTGNIAADPLFVGDGDYHLQASSPAIDTGNTEVAPGQDLEGNIRPVDGDGNGTSIADMGAYEYVYQAPPPSPPDLIITDVWNEGGNICYQIMNVGGAASPGGHSTALSLGEEQVASDAVDTALASGERLSRSFGFDWACTAATTVTVIADARNNLTESNEDNNSREEYWRCDLTPPQITSGPAISDITTTSAFITWSTDEPSDSTVFYGTSRSLLNAQQETDSTQTTEHSITLSNLQPSTTYCFKVASSDPAENVVSSRTMTFETQTMPDETNPTVSLIDPGQCTGNVLISTSASDDIGVQKVEFYLDGALVFTDFSPPYQLLLDTTLYENGQYNLMTKAIDLIGRSATDQSQIDISNVKDRTYPTVTITSHQDDDAVSGTINIRANITDDTGIDSVRFYVDGDYIEYSPCFPPVPTTILGETFVWNTKWVSDGLHSVAVEAMDMDGKLGAQKVRLDVVNQAAPPAIPYLTVIGNSLSRTQNRFTITLKVKNEGNAEASSVNIKYGLRGFQSIDASSAQVDFTAEYYAPGKFDICNITPKQNIPAGGTRTYTFNAIPILLYPNPPAPEPGFFIDMSWQSPGGSKYFDYVQMPAAKTTGGETIGQAYNNALKASDYLLVTNPGSLYAHNSKTDTSSLLSAMAQLVWDEQGVLAYFYSSSRGALNNLTKVGGSWSSKLKSGWTSNGYLLIVGEANIIPAWSYSGGSVEIASGEDFALKTDFTDLPYANTAGSTLSPELSIGRIIGNSASELEKVIQTSITVYEGGGIGMFDRSDFFSVSGYPKCLSGGCGNIDFKKEVLVNGLTMRNKGIDGIVMFTPDYSQYDAAGQINSLLTKNLIRQKFFGNTPNKDVIFLAGHGSAVAWDVISVNDILNTGIIMPFGVTSPFVFASSCLTGRYSGGTCPGEAFLQRGAGAYLGAVEPGLVPPHDSISKRFFEKWDAGESIGLAVKQTKQSNSGQYEDYWSVIYNLYGDPKFGSQGPPAGVSSYLSLTAEGEPPSSVDVVIPDYQVTQSEGQDYVEIPGGGILPVPGKPLIPYYRVFYDYPQGYQIQDVVLTGRSEPITATGLNIPDCLLTEPGQNTYDEIQQSPYQEWWPETDFEWTVQEKPDGITLAITIYPFYYNPLTTDVKFHQNYSFDIASTVSNIRITRLEINKPNFSINSVTGYVEFSDGEEGEIPPVGTDIVVDVIFRKQGSGEVIGSVPVRTLRNVRGKASCSFAWGVPEEMPTACDVEVAFRDMAGNLLDRKIDMFEPGAPSLDIREFNVSPQQCDPGGNINMEVQLENTGIYNIPSGTAVIRVRDQAGNNITEFNHELTDLVPGGLLSFSDSWNTSAVGSGTYHILSYALYGSVSTSPQIVEVTVGAPSQPDEFWPYTFEDSVRGTKLRIDTYAQTFQFITPDKEFPVKIASRMRVINTSNGRFTKYDRSSKKWKFDTRGLGLDDELNAQFSEHQFGERPKETIIIFYQDEELRLSAIAVDENLDFCVAHARDIQAKKHYLLVDKPGIESSGTTIKAPEPDFTASRTEGRAPLIVRFTDKSTGDITSWLWDFGDGKTSTRQNPLHVYRLAGDYTVTLTVTGPGGRGVIVMNDYIHIQSPRRRR